MGKKIEKEWKRFNNARWWTRVQLSWGLRFPDECEALIVFRRLLNSKSGTLRYFEEVKDIGDSAEFEDETQYKLCWLIKYLLFLCQCGERSVSWRWFRWFRARWLRSTRIARSRTVSVLSSRRAGGWPCTRKIDVLRRFSQSRSTTCNRASFFRLCFWWTRTRTLWWEWSVVQCTFTRWPEQGFRRRLAGTKESHAWWSGLQRQSNTLWGGLRVTILPLPIINRITFLNNVDYFCLRVQGHVYYWWVIYKIPCY